MNRPRGDYVERWPKRFVYAALLLSALQFYPWQRDAYISKHGFMLLAIWAVYALPNLLVESILGTNLGPPDSYFSAVPLLHGLIGAMLFSLLLAIPIYSANAVYSGLQAYKLLLNVSTTADYRVAMFLETTKLHPVNGNITSVQSWDTLTPELSGISLEASIGVLIVWVILFGACLLGPLSLPWVAGSLFACGTILSFTIMVYFSTQAEYGQLRSILKENVQLKTWTTHDNYKWVLLYINRQSLIGYGIFGTFAAYNATIRQPNIETFRKLTALCLTLCLTLFPFLHAVMSFTNDALQLKVQALFRAKIPPPSEELRPFVEWFAAYRVMQTALMLGTVGCMFEVWCNTWVRFLRGSFAFRFRSFYAYRPLATFLNCLILGGLTLIFATYEGTYFYRHFYPAIGPFVIVEMGQLIVFAGMSFSQIWDRMARHKNRVSALCSRLFKSLLTIILTSFLLATAVYRGILFVETEIMGQKGNHLAGRLAIIIIPLVLVLVGGIISAILQRRRGCKNVFCPLIIPSISARANGFFPGTVIQNANEHYWPEEFEVLPYDER